MVENIQNKKSRYILQRCICFRFFSVYPNFFGTRIKKLTIIMLLNIHVGINSFYRLLMLFYIA